MPPIIPKAFEPASVSKSGFSIAVRELRSGQFIQIGIGQAAQHKHFGGILDPKKDALKLELSNEHRQNHILTLELAEIDDPQAFNLLPGTKDSVNIKLQPWTQLAKGKRPAAELVVIAVKAPSTVHLRLPEYARPAVKKIGEGEPLMG